MNRPLPAVLALLGRVMIAAVFLLSAVGNKIPNFNDVVKAMAAEGVPLPAVALAGAIVFLIAGSLSVVAGFKARVGALLLLIFLGLATFYFHDFWNFKGAAKDAQVQSFLKNLAVGGGLVLLMAAGPGRYGFAMKQAKAD